MFILNWIKVSPPTGIRTANHPARCQSLQQLRYPGHLISQHRRNKLVLTDWAYATRWPQKPCAKTVTRKAFVGLYLHARQECKRPNLLSVANNGVIKWGWTSNSITQPYFLAFPITLSSTNSNYETIGPLSNAARCRKRMPIFRIFLKAVTKCLRPHLEPSHQQNKNMFCLMLS
jgi:hypothetical protein